MMTLLTPVLLAACLMFAGDDGSPSPSPSACDPCKPLCPEPPWPDRCFSCCAGRVLEFATEAQLKAIVGLDSNAAAKIITARENKSLTINDAQIVLAPMEFKAMSEKLKRLDKRDVQRILGRSKEGTRNQIEEKTIEAEPKMICPTDADVKVDSGYPEPTPSPTPPPRP